MRRRSTRLFQLPFSARAGRDCSICLLVAYCFFFVCKLTFSTFPIIANWAWLGLVHRREMYRMGADTHSIPSSRHFCSSIENNTSLSLCSPLSFLRVESFLPTSLARMPNKCRQRPAPTDACLYVCAFVCAQLSSLSQRENLSMLDAILSPFRCPSRYGTAPGRRRQTTQL